MERSIILVCLPLMSVLILACGNGVQATVADDEGSGGTISGTVISPSGNVVDWSQIHAIAGNQTYEAFSGFSGFYLMRIPTGVYNVSVYDFYNPQFWAPNVNVNVTGGSSTTVNFYLQPQAPSPVPEFDSFAAIILVLGLVATCIVTRRLKPNVAR